MLYLSVNAENSAVALGYKCGVRRVSDEFCHPLRAKWYLDKAQESDNQIHVFIFCDLFVD
jgi:hypothetical protein